MLTIVGNGMGGYNFKNLPIDIEEFDKIVCDRNFEESGDNILKLSFKDAKEYILANYNKENILYIVTGSPLFFSAGTLLASKLPKDMVQIIDNTSSKSYLLSKLAISENVVESISLHGRAKLDLDSLFRKRFTLILCDEKTVSRLKEKFQYLPKDSYRLMIGYKLGYSDEYIGEIGLDEIEARFDLKAPFVLLIERLFEIDRLPEDRDFVTERGMITKRYKRELSMQYLDLEPNMLMWDIGAGSGSCAISAYKRYRVRTVLFEKNPLRCEYIKENLSKHFVVDTILLEGEAQELWSSLKESPDRIFVGGGGEEVMKRLNELYERLNSNGEMLIVAVTLKNLSDAISTLNRYGISHSVISLSLTTYKGKLDMAEPQREIFMIKVLK